MQKNIYFLLVNQAIKQPYLKIGVLRHEKQLTNINTLGNI